MNFYVFFSPNFQLTIHESLRTKEGKIQFSSLEPCELQGMQKRRKCPDIRVYSIFNRTDIQSISIDHLCIIDLPSLVHESMRVARVILIFDRQIHGIEKIILLNKYFICS